VTRFRRLTDDPPAFAGAVQKMIRESLADELERQRGVCPAGGEHEVGGYVLAAAAYPRISHRKPVDGDALDDFPRCNLCVCAKCAAVFVGPA
jgi:hypothetical protein